MKPKKVLLVCMGNICRSPMAEGVLRDRARREGLPISTDSAGTIDNHVGESPDPRAQEAMREHGIDISDLQARQIRPSDFADFDLLLAMDASNLRGLLATAPDPALTYKAKLMMDYAPDQAVREVPDPYFGDQRGFEDVYEMLDRACANLIDELRRDE